MVAAVAAVPGSAGLDDRCGAGPDCTAEAFPHARCDMLFYCFALSTDVALRLYAIDGAIYSFRQFAVASGCEMHVVRIVVLF